MTEPAGTGGGKTGGMSPGDMGGSKLTTTESIKPHGSTQETAQQVRLREAQAEAAARKQEGSKVDIAAVVGNIEELLDNVGKETLHLASSDELASFLNYVNMAKADLQRVAQMERDKAVATAEVADED